MTDDANVPEKMVDDRPLRAMVAHRKAERDHWAALERGGRQQTWLSIWAAGVSALALLAASFSYYETYQAAQAAQGQLAAMQLDQRPWIKVTLAPTDLTWKSQRDGGRTPDGMFTVEPAINLQNVGKSLAKNVRVVTRAFIWSQDTERRAAQGVCNEPQPQQPRMIFPGESIDGSAGHFGYGGAALPLPSKDLIQIMLAGCVIYEGATTASAFHTAFAYELWQTSKRPGANPGERDPFFHSGAWVPATELRYDQRDSGNFAD